MGDLTNTLDRATTATIERLLAHLPQLLGAVASMNAPSANASR